MQPSRLGLAVLLPLLATTAVARAQVCQQLSGVYSATIDGATSGQSADPGGLCGAPSGPEAYYFYTAPQTGTYVIDTIGSDFDTVLYARPADGEPRCNDDIHFPDDLDSKIDDLYLTAGQFVTFVVDGFTSGNFILRINGNCPVFGHGDPRDLGNPPSVTLTGNTTCGSFLSGGYGCGDGGDNAPDAVFLYTAPAAGTYVIDTVDSSFDTILAVRSGGCTGPTLQCNDDISPENALSRVTLDLQAAQEISIAVDGFGSESGSFALHVRSTPFTPTPTATRTPTRTRTVTATRTATFTPSATRTPTATRTASGTRTTTRTRTPTASRTATATRSYTRTPTAPPTPTATTISPSTTPVASSTPTASSTSSATRTPSTTATPTQTPSATPTATATGTATSTATQTPSGTPTPTPTLPATPTSTQTSFPSQTQTATPEPSPTSTPHPPAAPVDVTCQTFFNTLGWFVRLDWSDTSFDESDFRVERLDSVAPEIWTEAGSVGADVTSFQLGPFDSGLHIDYRVRAHREADDAFSAPSNAVECTTSAPTATPTHTAALTPTVTHTPSPTPPAPPSSLCRSRRGGGYTCRIDFEIIPGGYAPVPFGDVIRDQYTADFGVRFSDGGWVIRPRLGTSSPDFALINATSGSQQEFNPGPLRIEFSGITVDRLALRVGLDQRIAGVRPVLTVFDDAGSRSRSVTGTEFNAAGTSISQLLVLAPPDFSIARAELLYTGDTPAARNAVETIDDVEVGLAGPPPCPVTGDTAAPVVRILSPSDGETWSSRTLPILYGTITEDSHALGPVTAEVQSFTERFSFDLGPYISRDEFDSRVFRFAVTAVGLFDLDNDITVRASDRACPAQHGSDTVRLHVETPPATLNFYALGLEVTQAIQDSLHVRGVVLEGNDPRLFLPLPYGAAMPLVANKLLAVRAYPGISGATDPVRGVPAELLVRRGSSVTTLVGAPIDVDPADNQFVGSTLDVGATVARRRQDVRKGWLFLLPLSLTRSGRIDEIELRVNPSRLSGPTECLGCNDRANVLVVTGLEFHTAAQLGIRVVHVRDKDTRLETEADAGPRTLCDSFHKSFPVAEGCGTHPSNGIYLTRVVKEYDSRDWTPGTDTTQKLRELACKAGSSGRKSAAFYQENLALAPAASTSVGYGTGYGGSGCSSAAEYDWPTAAQEVGHSWLLCHAPCGNPPMLCSAYPTTDATTGDEGFHTGRLKVMPRFSLDWMSYCDDYNDPPDFNNWVSPYVYRRLQSGLVNAAGGALSTTAAAPVAGDVHLALLASGTIRDTEEAELDPFYVVPSRAPEGTVEGGPYALELVAADESVLLRWEFAAEDLAGEPGIETFHLEIPYDESTARVVLTHGSDVLGEWVASPTAPTVELLAPGAGDHWSADERVEVRWAAEDADGDPLFARVQYSTDGGNTWLGVADDLTSSAFALQGSDLPGSEAGLIRVLVSDGLRTAVQSQPISVAFKDPELRISGAPPDGVARPGSVLSLRADYLDLDDQPVSEEEIVWHSDRLGVLSHGAELELEANALPPGANRISASIPGKQRPTVSASIVLLRPAQTAEILAPCGNDCDENGAVTVDEIVAATTVTLGTQSAALCSTYDPDLLATVTRALQGCAASGAGL